MKKPKDVLLGVCDKSQVVIADGMYVTSILICQGWVIGCHHAKRKIFQSIYARSATVATIKAAFERYYLDQLCGNNIYILPCK